MPRSTHHRRMANIAFLAAATRKLVPNVIALVACTTKPKYLQKPRMTHVQERSYMAHPHMKNALFLAFDVSPNGSRERPPAELNKVVEVPWFCERAVWSELTGVWKS